jgi:hypothetical protein
MFVSTKEVTAVARMAGVSYKRAYRSEGSRSSRVKLFDVQVSKARRLVRELKARFPSGSVVEMDSPFEDIKSVAVYF